MAGPGGDDNGLGGAGETIVRKGVPVPQPHSAFEIVGDAGVERQHPDSLLRAALADRSWEASEPVHALDAATARVNAIKEQLRTTPNDASLLKQLNQAEEALARVQRKQVAIDPEGVGKPTGVAQRTYARVQLMDNRGQVILSLPARNVSPLHAEFVAADEIEFVLVTRNVRQALRAQGIELDLVSKQAKLVEPQLRIIARDYQTGQRQFEMAVGTRRVVVTLDEIRVPGGHLDVAVDQEVCEQFCRPRLQRLGARLDLESIDAHTPSLPGKTQELKAKGSARIATMKLEGRAGTADTSLRRVTERLYERAVQPPVDGNASRGTTYRRAETALQRDALITGEARGTSPAKLKQARITVTRKVNLQVQLSKQSLKSYQRAQLIRGTTATAGAILQLGYLVTQIAQAIHDISRLDANNVSPAAREARAIVEEHYPQSDKLAFRLEPRDHAEAERSIVWLNDEGIRTLMEASSSDPAARKRLVTMGERLDFLYSYIRNLEALEEECRGYIEELAPFAEDLAEEARVLALGQQAAEEFFRVPDEITQHVAMFYWRLFREASQDLEFVRKAVDSRFNGYRLEVLRVPENLNEQFSRIRSGEKRDRATEVYNLWAPSFIRAWGKPVRFPFRIVESPVD